MAIFSAAFGQQSEEMAERTWNVRPDFMSQAGGVDSGGGPFLDPFAVDDSKPEVNRATAREILESVGIAFPEGSSARFDPRISTLIVRNTPENLKLVEQFIEDNLDVTQKQIVILTEHIALEHGEAAKLLREQLARPDANANVLRVELAERIALGAARIVDSQLVTTRSGQRAKEESIAEEIYPIESDPGESPYVLTGELNGNTPLVSPIRATAFETRNAGSILGVDPVVGNDGETIDLNISSKRVALHDWRRHGKGASEVRQPLFYTQRISSAISVQDGDYALLGLLTPEPKKGELPNSSSERTLLFLRATLVDPAMERLRGRGGETDADVPLVDHVGIMTEHVELTRADAAAVMAIESEPLDDSARREWVDALLATGEARRLETSYLAARSGQKAQNASLAELIYPTVFGAFDRPVKFAGEGADARFVIPPAAHSFQTRNLGAELTVTPRIEQGGGLDMDVSVFLTNLLRNEAVGHPDAGMKRPVFHSMKSVARTPMLSGKPLLIGVHVALDPKTRKPNPQRRVLVFATAAAQFVR